jgi:hypothetical protein
MEFQLQPHVPTLSAQSWKLANPANGAVVPEPKWVLGHKNPHFQPVAAMVTIGP